MKKLSERLLMIVVIVAALGILGYYAVGLLLSGFVGYNLRSGYVEGRKYADELKKTPHKWECSLVDIIDETSLIVDCNAPDFFGRHTIRVLGIKPFSTTKDEKKLLFAKLKEILKTAERVNVISDLRHDKDEQGRLLRYISIMQKFDSAYQQAGYVYRQGDFIANFSQEYKGNAELDVGGTLISMGYALADDKGISIIKSHYQSLQERSKKAKHGLWQLRGKNSN